MHCFGIELYIFSILDRKKKICFKAARAAKLNVVFAVPHSNVMLPIQGQAWIALCKQFYLHMKLLISAAILQYPPFSSTGAVCPLVWFCAASIYTKLKLQE